MTYPSIGNGPGPFPLAVFIVAISILTAACGKVGDPLPPFIRVPEPVDDLAVRQRGYELWFNWTNPRVNVDGSGSTELDRVVLLGGGEVVATVAVSGPGQPQTLRVDGRDLVGSRIPFTVRVATVRERTSAESNRVIASVVDVPGPVAGLRATFDQERVRLEWDAPSERSGLVGAYRVYRSGAMLEAQPSLETRYDDGAVREGDVYEYAVLAVRQGDGVWIEGVASEPLPFIAQDHTPPAAPTGLALTPGPAGSGAALHWVAGPETDLVRYRVFRREDPDGPFETVGDDAQTTTALFDPEYRPGYAYMVSAIDRSGNESPMSVPVS